MPAACSSEGVGRGTGTPLRTASGTKPPDTLDPHLGSLEAPSEAQDWGDGVAELSEADRRLLDAYLPTAPGTRTEDATSTGTTQTTSSTRATLELAGRLSEKRTLIDDALSEFGAPSDISSLRGYLLSRKPISFLIRVHSSHWILESI